MKIQLKLLLSFACLLVCNSSSIQQPWCHDEERSFLLQFKQSQAIDMSACEPSGYTKVNTWKLGSNTSDCCSWDGVECDKDTGYVIGLDLTSSCLYGSINSSSSLFRLVHLTSLNLAYNNFNRSKIPPGIMNLLSLTSLNLSFSNFSDQIPSEILELSNLVSLDLSDNPLMLRQPSLKDLVERLIHLTELHLSGVIISSEVPQSLANLSSLSSLLLRDCKLQGQFPVTIFQLPNLRFLSVRSNPFLAGYLPEFKNGSTLEMLRLERTNFSGQLPYSIRNLKSLSNFVASGCRFWGAIPSSVGNLSNLNFLDLSDNNFSGQIPSSFGNLLQLSYLSLSFNSFSPGTLYWLGNLTNLYLLGLVETNSYGDIPSSVQNLTQLSYLWLHSNQLTGQIPSWIGNFTHLVELQLAKNKLQGPIPESIFELPNLEVLELHSNILSGTLKSDLILKPKYLYDLQLSENNLSLVGSPNSNATLSKLRVLGLSSCNLREFPAFLRWQNELEFLDLSRNKLEGLIPNWILNWGIENLTFLNLAYNFLTGFEQPLNLLPWTNLHVFNLTSNEFQGTLPVPPPFITIYSVSKNKFNGEISPLFCNLTSVLAVDLSSNNLTGELPPCLGNLGNFVSVLDLRNNSFSGKIPDEYTIGCKLRMIDLSQNKIEGKVPRSLANCTMLEILNFGKNQINDIFPSWLGILPELRILTLRSNKLHGAIGEPLTSSEFSRLQIIDLSDNNCTGKLPVEYIRNWAAMKIVDKDHLLYMQANTSFQIRDFLWHGDHIYSITMTNKGTETVYQKILEFFVAIDLSNNRFEGGIPEVIGSLKELQLLNLSKNILTGSIPSSLGNLKQLEALDFSTNKLSGEIPMQLARLTFLSFFNASHNHLTGPIPRGNQFDTFQNNSFEANLGLCGYPLSEKCGDKNGTSSLAPPEDEDEDSESSFEFSWKVALIGYASGLLIGVIIGGTMNIRKYEWLIKNLMRWQSHLFP
eukprot:XP_002515406.2 receptor-like protein 7 [Ricinus communis]